MNRQQLAAAPEHAQVGRAHDAEPGFELRVERVVLVGQHVVAHAEEREVVGDQPFQERYRLGDFLGGRAAAGCS